MYSELKTLPTPQFRKLLKFSIPKAFGTNSQINQNPKPETQNYLTAIVSISTKAPIGSDFTANAERAGHSV